MSYILNENSGRIQIEGSSGFLLFELSSNPQIFYAGRTIDLAFPPYQWQARPLPTAKSTVTLTGRVETICSPRIDNHVVGAFRIVDSATKRAQLYNWWQWASRGKIFAVTLDSNRTVSTTLSADAEAGDTALSLISTEGIVRGGYYKLFHGPNYQLVQVEDILGSTVTLTESLDLPFGGVGLEYPAAYQVYAAHFRDENYFVGAIRDKNAPIPIVDSTADDLQYLPQRRFTLNLDFYESRNAQLA